MHLSGHSTKERVSPHPQARRTDRSAGSDFELGDMSGHESDYEESGLARAEPGPERSRERSNSWNAAAKDTDASSRDVFGKTLGTLWNINLADAQVLKHLVVNALLIASWYTFSLSISLYNQWMFSGNHLNFKFPLFTTCLHMLVQFFLSTIVLYLFPRFRPNASTPDAPPMTQTFYLTRIGPCGAATGLDIGLGNMSMRFITLTFYTMCKSSVLGFVLLFAFIFRLERPSLKLMGIIAVMTVGVILMVAGETEFSPKGFGLIMSAACFSGFRWALTQILLLRNPATSNPFSSLFYLAPVMFITLLAIAVPVEGVSNVAEGLGELFGKKGTLWGIALLLFPGTLAFCMTSSEFALLKRTSVVTLSVCGIFKEVVTIVAAQNTLDHDRMTPVNLAGLAVTIASIATYNYMKITKMRGEAQEQVRQGREPNVGPSVGLLADEDGEERDEAARPMLDDEDGRNGDDRLRDRD